MTWLKSGDSVKTQIRVLDRPGLKLKHMEEEAPIIPMERGFFSVEPSCNERYLED